jgi:hypothetical protein
MQGEFTVNVTIPSTRNVVTIHFLIYLSAHEVHLCTLRDLNNVTS